MSRAMRRCRLRSRIHRDVWVLHNIICSRWVLLLEIICAGSRWNLLPDVLVAYFWSWNGMVEFHKVLAIRDPDWSTKCFSSLGSAIVKKKDEIADERAMQIWSARGSCVWRSSVWGSRFYYLMFHTPRKVNLATWIIILDDKTLVAAV